MVVFGLARDGCLVRSWFGVAQRGVGAALRGALLVWMGSSKPYRNQHRYREAGGFFLSLN